MKTNQEKIIEVDGLDLLIQRRPRQKHIYLRVKAPGGQVVVSGPMSLTEAMAIDLVRAHRQDLVQAKNRIVQSKIYGKKTYQEGEAQPLWGKEFPLHLQVGKKEGVQVKGGGLYLTHRNRDQAGLEKILEAFYRDQLKERDPGLLLRAKEATGLSPKEWRIKKMKTRWGSCNMEKKRIWLNLHLAKYQEDCLYGVIIHELTHFLERSHNRRFYDLVQNFYPDYKKSQTLLRD